MRDETRVGKQRASGKSLRVATRGFTASFSVAKANRAEGKSLRVVAREFTRSQELKISSKLHSLPLTPHLLPKQPLHRL